MAFFSTLIRHSLRGLNFVVVKTPWKIFMRHAHTSEHRIGFYRHGSRFANLGKVFKLPPLNGNFHFPRRFFLLDLDRSTSAEFTGRPLFSFLTIFSAIRDF